MSTTTRRSPGTTKRGQKASHATFQDLERINARIAPFRLEHKVSPAGDWFALTGPGIAEQTFGAAAIGCAGSELDLAVAAAEQLLAVFRAGIASVGLGFSGVGRAKNIRTGQEHIFTLGPLGEFPEDRFADLPTGDYETAVQRFERVERWDPRLSLSVGMVTSDSSSASKGGR